MKRAASLPVRLAVPHAWRSRWRAAHASARQRWHRMTAREQRLVLLLAAIAALALLFATAVRPAWRDVARWQAELPRLRAQAAQVDALVQEAQALQRSQGARIAAQDMDEEIAAGLARAGLGGSHRVMRLDQPEPAWEAAFENVSAAALFSWLAHEPGRLRMTLYEAEIARPRDALGKPAPGRASGMVRLRAGLPQDQP